MKPTRWLAGALFMLIVTVVDGRAQTAADSAAIRETALNYVLSWYEGKPERMEKALHPELAKRIVQTDPQGRSRLGQQSALTLINGVRSGGGKNTPVNEQIQTVKILDIYQNSASVRADMSGWIDYMHMAKWNGEWRIVNVLWELKPRTGS